MQYAYDMARTHKKQYCSQHLWQPTVRDPSFFIAITHTIYHQTSITPNYTHKTLVLFIKATLSSAARQPQRLSLANRERKRDPKRPEEEEEAEEEEKRERQEKKRVAAEAAL